MTTKQGKRRILLAVSGMSPQIITETLFALLQRELEPWVPDEIHLITTKSGAEQAKLQLLEPQIDGPGYFYRLLRDYPVDHTILFDDSTIHLINNSTGEALDDLRTPVENEMAANYITNKVREFTADDNSELHVSLAGGRKTMGFYVGYALSLFGRQRDRLSHVLVSTEFESLRDFYYPTPETRVIQREDRNSGKAMSLDARNAKIWLAEIPIVRLRDNVSDTGLLGGQSFSEVVNHIEKMASLPPKLTVDDRRKCISVHDTKIQLADRDYAFYRWFIQMCLEGQQRVEPPLKDTEGDKEMAEQYLHIYSAIKGEMADIDLTEKALETGMDRNHFDSSNSRVNRALRKSLGKLGEVYQIKKQGRRGHSTYALTLSAEEIDILD